MRQDIVKETDTQERRGPGQESKRKERESDKGEATRRRRENMIEEKLKEGGKATGVTAKKQERSKAAEAKQGRRSEMGCRSERRQQD